MDFSLRLKKKKKNNPPRLKKESVKQYVCRLVRTLEFHIEGLLYMKHKRAYQVIHLLFHTVCIYVYVRVCMHACAYICL